MQTRVELERITLREHYAVQVRVIPLILSATDINNASGTVKLTVGYRGLPNIKDELSVGDYAEIQVPDHGIFEVRLMHVYYNPYPYGAADVAISCLELSRSAVAIESVLPSIDPLRSDVDAPFTASEKIAIRRALQEFRNHIRNEFHPTPQQETAVADELKNLSDLLDSLRRRVDWKGIVISTLINIGTTLSLSPDHLRQIAAAFVALLRSPLGLP